MSFIQRYLRTKVLEPISQAHIEEFISRHIEESLNLEYKDTRILNKPNDLAITVSSFANSDGGLLVVGISERKEGNRRFPGEITWDDNPKHDPEWFETVVLNRIHPMLKGVRVVPVRSQKGIIFLIDIPPSLTPPHMAPDGRYYFRRNFSKYPMEHYQVSDAFGKRAKPILFPRVKVKGYSPEEGTFQFQVTLVNDGHMLAKWPFFQLRVVGCKHMKKDASAHWEHIIHETGEDGLQEEVIEYQPPINVIHAGMANTLHSHTFEFNSPIVIGKIILAAELAETKTFVIVITHEWLRNLTADIGTEIDIDLPIVGRDEHEEWPEELTDSIRDCFDGMSEVESRPYVARFVEDFMMHPSVLGGILLDYQEENKKEGAGTDKKPHR